MNKFKRICTDLFLTLKYFPFDLVRRPDESVYSWMLRFNRVSNEQPTLQDFEMNGFAVCFRKTDTVTSVYRNHAPVVEISIPPYTEDEIRDRSNWCNEMFGPENWAVIAYENSDNSNDFPRKSSLYVFGNDDMMLNFRIAFGEK